MLLLLWTLLYFALLVLLTARITILFSDDVIFEKLVTRKLRDIACVHPWPDSWHHVNDATLPRDDPARRRVGNCTRANRAARFLVNLLDCPWCVSVWVAAPVAADLALGLSGAGLSPLSATSPLPEALWRTSAPWSPTGRSAAVGPGQPRNVPSPHPRRRLPRFLLAVRPA